MSRVELVGVLNVTPDSFSDGGKFLEVDSAFKQAQKLLSDGASLIDIGADSTRPGSCCVGPEEELNRLKPIVEKFAGAIPFAVDTHHSEVAQFAIEHGALMINDVMAGADAEMCPVIADSAVKYVVMYSRCREPHNFSKEPKGSILENIKRFLGGSIETALQFGIKEEQIVLDPGMGAFISDDPQNSWRVIRNFSELEVFGLPLYFGVSRKGFLKLPLEQDLNERDFLSSFTGKLIENSLSEEQMLYIRVHNVSLQKQVLEMTKNIDMFS